MIDSVKLLKTFSCYLFRGESALNLVKQFSGRVFSGYQESRKNIMFYPGHHRVEVIDVYAGDELLTERLNEPRPVDVVSEREVT